MIPAITLVSSLIQMAPALTKIFKGSEKSITVAEQAAQLARQLTGTNSNETALETFKQNPDKLVEYQKLLLDNEAEIERLYTEDKTSARERDVEFLKAGTRNYRADFLVAISVIVVFVILAVVIMVADLNEYAKGALTTILGVFLNQLTNVFAFEFGTTRKTEDTQNQVLKDYIKS